MPQLGISSTELKIMQHVVMIKWLLPQFQRFNIIKAHYNIDSVIFSIGVEIERLRWRRMFWWRSLFVYEGECNNNNHQYGFCLIQQVQA